MSIPNTLLAAAAALLFALPSHAADGIAVVDPYARASSPTAKSGAVFMVLENSTDTDDVLVAAATSAAAVVELHTHVEDAEGVMRMVEVEDGIAVPAGGRVELRRGGLHVMMMGLTAPLEQGAGIDLTLTFEKAGDITLTVPVDNERMDMGAHGAGN